MFGEVLKRLREKAGISQEQLADAVGLSKSTIGMYEQGNRTPHKKEILKAISDYFDVTVDYLFGFSEMESYLTEEICDQFGLRTVSTRRIPKIGKIACGEPIICNQDYENFAETSDELNADFCLTARGDSMINARIFDGDTVFIRKQPKVDNGEIAVVIVNGEEITLKRFYYYPERSQVVLQPENPTYKPMVFTDDELDQILVVGKAIAFMGRVN